MVDEPEPHSFPFLEVLQAAEELRSKDNTFHGFGNPGEPPCLGHDLCLYPGDQLLAQIFFVLAIVAWILVTVTPVLLVSKVILGTSMMGFEPTDDHTNALAYSPMMQMLGMDEVKHGGMSGSETSTVYSQQPNPASTNTKNPTQGAVNPRKRRSSVVGQAVMAADDDDAAP